MTDATVVTDADLAWLRRCVELAADARARGDHPFGSLLVTADGRTVEALNSVVTRNDPTGHAETNLVRAAAASLPAEVLATSTLYTSTEPCAMCAGAIYWSGIARVVYALSEQGLARSSPSRRACPRCTCPAARSSPAAGARSRWPARPTCPRRRRCTRASGSDARAGLDPAFFGSLRARARLPWVCFVAPASWTPGLSGDAFPTRWSSVLRYFGTSVPRIGEIVAREVGPLRHFATSPLRHRRVRGRSRPHDEEGRVSNGCVIALRTGAGRCRRPVAG